ncbi:MAG: hypothetical protein Q4B51_07530 [Coriobacteriaceae bacterium]|nr:hypothetical protein [Coriobacteriaceae bacterium]
MSELAEKWLSFISATLLIAINCILSIWLFSRELLPCEIRIDIWIHLFFVGLLLILACGINRIRRYTGQPSYVIEKRKKKSSTRHYNDEEAKVINPIFLANESSKDDKVDNAKYTANCIASYFTTLLLSPQSAITRITESVEPGSKSLRVNSSYTFRIPLQLIGKPIVVPLLIQRKDELIDSLKIYDNNGNRIPSMSAEESDSFFLLVVTHFLEICDFEKTDISNCREQFKHILNSGFGKSDYDAVNEGKIVIRNLFSNYSDTKSQEKRKRLELIEFILISLLEGFASCFLVCTRLYVNDLPLSKEITGRESIAFNANPARNLRVLIEYRLPLQPVHYGTGRCPDAIKRTFDCLANRPIRIHYSLANADRCRSYHLTSCGPEGTYFAEGSIKPIDGLIGLEQSFNNPPYAESFSAQNSSGQRREHVNIKHGKGFSDYVYSSSFLERPPTSFQMAFFSSLVGTIVLTCFLSFLKNINNSSIAAGLITFALTGVTAAGGWVTSRSRDGRGIQTLPWLSGCTTILVAVFSIISYALYRCINLDFHNWIILTSAGLGIQFTNTILCLKACLTRGFIHHTLIRKQPKYYTGIASPNSSGICDSTLYDGRSFSKSINQYRGGWFSGSHDRDWWNFIDTDIKEKLQRGYDADESFIRDIIFFADSSNEGDEIINYLHNAILGNG